MYFIIILFASCTQEMIPCTNVEDALKLLSNCDNSNGHSTKQCEYNRTIGTIYSNKAIQDMKISKDISLAIQVPK